jgi:hypothetical protein
MPVAGKLSGYIRRFTDITKRCVSILVERENDFVSAPARPQIEPLSAKPRNLVRSPRGGDLRSFNG